MRALLLLTLCLSIVHATGCNRATSPSSASMMTASNGVPIPAPDPRDTCAALGVEFVPCSGDCVPVRCDCGGGQSWESFGFCSRGCLTRVSCPTACALGERATVRALFCEHFGVCKRRQDCKPVSTCLIAPGAASGICSTREEGSACFEGADCDSSACVVVQDNVRQCSGGQTGSPCNRHEHCAANNCINRPNSYEGVCTGGANGDVCLVDGDCKVTLGRCVDGLCSNGTPGTHCLTKDDCYGNPCVRHPGEASGMCDTGKDGARCIDVSDCAVPFCIEGKCSSGALGHTCYQDVQCVSGKCGGAEGFMGACTEGKLGQACRLGGSQCEDGLRCVPDSNQNKCAPLGALGTPCNRDADCQSQRCAPPPNAPGPVCTANDAGAPTDASAP